MSDENSNPEHGDSNGTPKAKRPQVQWPTTEPVMFKGHPLPKGESAVYRAIEKLGSAAVGEIAAELGVKAQSVFNPLGNLRLRGLVSTPESTYKLVKE